MDRFVVRLGDDQSSSSSLSLSLSLSLYLSEYALNTLYINRPTPNFQICLSIVLFTSLAYSNNYYDT